LFAAPRHPLWNRRPTFYASSDSAAAQLSALYQQRLAPETASAAIILARSPLDAVFENARIG
jgi:hypothetical protein